MIEFLLIFWAAFCGGALLGYLAWAWWTDWETQLNRRRRRRDKPATLESGRSHMRGAGPGGGS